MPAHRVYVGLGSNLENPVDQIARAEHALRTLAVDEQVLMSSLYASTAVGPPQPDYVNAVAQFDTELPPLDLLDALQAIEQAQGRVRLEHWGPRTLDLDILLIDDLQLREPRLVVPHPFMAERNFVLIPLLELAPALRLPSGEAVADLAHRIGRAGLTQLNLR